MTTQHTQDSSWTIFIEILSDEFARKLAEHPPGGRRHNPHLLCQGHGQAAARVMGYARCTRSLV